ncbi:hypothetical protein M409DRAFT_49894 [Zasmidium cellare ATCC 36951]|uniref:Uncharacterized protein n=1 Tax=Zasmidium cellare ATCC 36951 TaxID=1080233 RepID=A0A6A6D3B6_ZASCE|nr:uncharacterized protein M409DRAFT_49894 [Zasmidium cellare ATCC 36951]KAF2172156.1 hypothetical protein M409DRAFT_49894 [Zasmidium cellare ATCC 36951]
MRVPEFGNPLMPLISMRMSNPDSNPGHSSLNEQLTLYLDWTSRPNMIFDSVRNKFIPPGSATRKLVLDRTDKYPTDPPLPTTISVARINISQTPIYCTVSAAPHVVFSYHSASVEASVCPCTFGDMIMVAQVLLRTPPKGWNSNTVSLEWRPREDHPEIASHDELDKAIDMIQVWPVVYNRVLCKPIPIDDGQFITAPP